MEEILHLIDENVLNELRLLNGYLRSYASTFILDAQSLCALLMLIYFSIKSYALMTGDSKFEVLPLLRPFGLTMVVILWIPFLSLIDDPLNALEEKAKDRFVNQRVEINDLFIRRIQLITAVNERIYEETEPLNQLDETNSSMIPGMDEIIGAMGRARILIQAKLKLILKELLEMIVVIFFKVMQYLLLYAKILFSNMLAIIGPLSFAVSIIPAFRDSYIQWISKYVGVMLYGMFGYVAMILALTHVKVAIIKENHFYETLLNTPGEQGVRNLMAYLGGVNVAETSFLVALVVGGIGMICVPIISSWVLHSGSTSQLFNKAMGTAGKAVSVITK